MKTIALELQPCCGERAGIGNYTYELASRLAADEHIAYCGNVFNFLGRNDNAEALSGVRIPIRVNRTMPYGVYRRVWNLAPVSYGSLFPSADINHFFNYIVPPRVCGKVITTIHDVTHLRYPDTMDPRNLRRIRSGLASSIERSDYIITVSQFSRCEIVELLGVSPEKLGIVPCAPSLAGGVADFASIARTYNITQPYILYVGTIEPRKNLTGLIAAYNLFRSESGLSHQLVLAGGAGWQNGDIHRAAEASAYRGDIIFTGYVHNVAKNALYQHAAVFAYPSLYEGFGIPPLEAMALGAPVVCSNAASLPEVTGDAASLVNPLDTHDIAKGLYNILSNPDYASKLQARGRERIKNYTWDASVKRLTDIYKTLLNDII